MQQRRRRVAAVVLLQKILVCAICTIALVGLLSGYVHVLPSSRVSDFSDTYKLPTQHEFNYQRLSAEKRWAKEEAPPHLSKLQSPPHLSKFDGASGNLDFEKLWKPPEDRDFVPCIQPSSNYAAPDQSRGYLLVRTNGGLNQMRTGICDMVAIARIINATLVVPELDKQSFWQDTSNFSDVFDEDHFINALANDVKVVKKLPKELSSATNVVKHFRSGSGLGYYRDTIGSLWEEYQVIRAAKSDSRLANNNLPPNIQKLRCRACYEALRFAPKIEAMAKLLVDRMRSYGHFIALHLRYEKDMLAFSGCTHGLSNAEAKELKTIRQKTAHWKVKNIDARGQRAKGRCPLTPKEVGIFLNALGFPSKTPIYIAAGEIYGGDTRMADLRSRYPMLMSKEKLASVEELEPFTNHSSQMAALDYIVSVESDVFIPSYSGNMAKAVEGHRRFLGHRKTITPDRKGLVRVFGKIEKGVLKEGTKVSDRIIEIHKKLQGSPRRRKGPVPGTKGMDRFHSEESFYGNPLPDCLCQRVSQDVNTSIRIRLDR
ncbi:hypothetical protein like AT1G22460 [Hibiscus trionum]|uniref:O-fucosyltransferase family protein n=1 Tax=Hibiscus trionum TaxID=183268 RepID=A0A9W7M7M9_HIBTR|nr:hypothetical protein like AT1G22460 [Hibiscus trionum]